MTYGEKLIKLKDSLNIKYFADYGKLMGVSGDWLNDNAKKENPPMVNIQNLIKIANYHHISLDYFFDNDDDKLTVEIPEELKQSDIVFVLEDLVRNIDQYNSFYGITMNSESKKILIDGIDILKGLVRQKI